MKVSQNRTVKIRIDEVPAERINDLARALLGATERLFQQPGTAEDFARWEAEYDKKQAAKTTAAQI